MSKEREFLKKLRYASLLENDLRKELDELLAQPESLREDLREDLREGTSLRDATNDGLRKEIANLRTANDRQEADLRLAKTALAETMKLFNNQPNDSGLRDHFAGLAMQGLLSGIDNYTTQTKATWAYNMADAMLAEREKK